MEKTKVKVSKIIELHEAVTSIEQNDRLKGRTSYWLGRMADSCLSAVKSFNTQRTKIAVDVQKRQEPAIKAVKELGNAPENTAEINGLNLEIDKLNKEFTDRVEAISQIEDEVLIPVLKSSEFFGKDGESLVPVKFFKLMGEYITED